MRWRSSPRRWAPSQVREVAANPRIKNCPRKSRKPAECYRLSACELSSTALRKCPYLTTQLPKRAFIAKHLNIGSGAARPATPDTTSSGKALNGDFTNTAHQRSTRQTIAFAQSCGKLQWVLSPRPMRTETLLYMRPTKHEDGAAFLGVAASGEVGQASEETRSA